MARPVNSGTVVDLTGTAVDFDAPATHPTTDSEEIVSFASSGFFNMFADDLRVEGHAVRPTRHDTQEDVESDDESVASGRSGASEEGLRSLDASDLLEAWKIKAM